MGRLASAGMGRWALEGVGALAAVAGHLAWEWHKLKISFTH